MENVSKISRSIIVVIFTALMVFLGYQNIIVRINFKELFIRPMQFIEIPNLAKVLYVVVLIIMVVMYAYLKEKLYKIKVKRKLSLFYRYIYLIVLGTVTSFLALFQTRSFIEPCDAIIFTVLSLCTGLVVKKIIFNVSKSDILSVIGMLSCTSWLNVIINKNYVYVSRLMCLFAVLVIWFLQILVDELKQKGVKNSKYFKLAIVEGIFMGISVLFGINPIVYLSLAIVIFFISFNLDNTHITFPRKFMENISKEKREFLYKIERINVSKLLICVIVTIGITCILFLIGIKCTTSSVFNFNNNVLNEIVELFNSNRNININFNFSTSITDGITYCRTFLVMSKNYYMFLIVYILFMEGLAFVLKRKYDTKSTIMKFIFLMIFSTMVVFKVNVNFYQPILTVLLIMIAIVNTSNIYLNREERIKLLVA